MTADKPVVLIIEDEKPMRAFLKASMESEGFRLAEVETGKDGMAKAASLRPDIIILDLGLPDIDGLKVILAIREWSRTPIIVLSARGKEGDKVAALDAGADDYVTKPFGVGELLARIRVALRNSARVATQGEQAADFSTGDLRIDFVARRVFLAGEELHLTPIEYRLICLMARHAGKVLTHRLILQEIWGPAYVEQIHSLRVFMASLRRKIENHPAQPRYLLTEQGVGYRLRGD